MAFRLPPRKASLAIGAAALVAAAGVVFVPEFASAGHLEPLLGLSDDASNVDTNRPGPKGAAGRSHPPQGNRPAAPR